MLKNIGFYSYLLKSKVKAFFSKEDGAVDIVAIVILIAIAVGVALLFKDKIAELINNIFNTISPEGLTDKPTVP